MKTPGYVQANRGDGKIPAVDWLMKVDEGTMAESKHQLKFL